VDAAAEVGGVSVRESTIADARLMLKSPPY
jgi:hypothetical protein